MRQEIPTFKDLPSMQGSDWWDINAYIDHFIFLKSGSGKTTEHAYFWNEKL